MVVMIMCSFSLSGHIPMMVHTFCSSSTSLPVQASYLCMASSHCIRCFSISSWFLEILGFMMDPMSALLLSAVLGS